MIIDKIVKVKIRRDNIDHYIKYFPNINIRDIIEINVEDHLMKGSNMKINVKCDICYVQRYISYLMYNKNLNSCESHRIYTCDKCSHIKIKDSNLKKYGVEYYSQHPERNDKVKKTSLERYGVEHHSKSDNYIEKVSRTNLEKFGFINPFMDKERIKESYVEKWGVDHPLKVQEIKDRIKKTNLDRYGVESVLKSPEVQEKIKKTNLEKYGGHPMKSQSNIDKVKLTNMERYKFHSYMLTKEFKDKSLVTNLKNYGFDNPMKSDSIKDIVKKTNLDRYGVESVLKSLEVQEKIKKTNLEKYGTEYPLKNDKILEKLKNTNLIRYGVDHPSKSTFLKIKNTKIGSDIGYISYDGEGIHRIFCEKGHEFVIKGDNYLNRISNNISICTICNPIGESTSIKEKDLFEFVSSTYEGEVIHSYRDGLEIDVYLPDLKIGFEFNGLYWHSEEYKDKNYHIDKLNYFRSKDIRIIHIWEDDWHYKNDIIKSMIKNQLNRTENKIGARKCDVYEIKDIKLVRDFLNKNHIQGDYPTIGRSIGLFYNNDLISLMTLDHSEGRKKMSDTEWNLSRFCNKLDYSVIGGASKLIKFFVDVYQPTRIISYADKGWSRGNLYEKLGFMKSYETNPDYKYIVDGFRKHKSGFRKSKLMTNLSESQYMKKSQIKRIWDCGKMKFEMIL